MNSRRFEVRLTAAADRDLDNIHDFAAGTRSPDEAGALIDELLDKAESLSRFPDRGSVPPELEAIGEYEYRQLVHAPYRIIYRRIETIVYVYMIADGRRDVRWLLQNRLLHG